MTGGTWANAGELLGVTGGPDDGPAMSVAERPTAGTISGGTSTRTRPRRRSSFSPSFGFFLRGNPVLAPWIPPQKIEFLRGGSSRLRDY
jgi:hypothetical protein